MIASVMPASTLSNETKLIERSLYLLTSELSIDRVIVLTNNKERYIGNEIFIVNDFYRWSKWMRF